jgi:predicted HAD superfamily hydrolase
MLSRYQRYSASLFRDVDLVSTDVFDTLLLRTARSERLRIVTAEGRFAQALAAMGLSVREAWLVEARLEAQKRAYRALDMSPGDGEVRFLDITRRQLAVLGLPASLLQTKLAIEIDVERESLRPNRTLAEALRRCRRAGQRIIAVSDIALPASALERLIADHHGASLIDAVYSSADAGATKRGGRLFAHVLAAEGVAAARMLHIGDDEVADRQMPAAMGIRTLYRPRARSHRLLSRSNVSAISALETV